MIHSPLVQVHHYQPSILPAEMIRGETMLTHQAAGAHDLDDSAGDMTYNYGSRGIDSGVYDKLLANEKENFGVLISKVWEFIVCLL